MIRIPAGVVYCTALSLILLFLQFLVKQFHMVEATYRVREAKKQLYSVNGRHPNDEEVAEATGLSMKRLAAVLLTPKAPRSLEQKIGINQNLKPSVCPSLLPLIDKLCPTCCHLVVFMCIFF